MFFKGSRYTDVENAELVDAAGKTVRYKKIRFIPPTKPIRTHTLTDGERLDNIAFRYLRDPERFWRICDANFAMWPNELVETAGEKILIPKSEA